MEKEIKKEIEKILWRHTDKMDLEKMTQIVDELYTLIQIIFDPENQPNQLGIKSTFEVDMVIRSGIVGDLLYKFWQRTSDACPLEATEAEKQEKEFKEWVMSLDWDKIINL